MIVILNLYGYILIKSTLRTSAGQISITLPSYHMQLTQYLELQQNCVVLKLCEQSLVIIKLSSLSPLQSGALAYHKPLRDES